MGFLNPPKPWPQITEINRKIPERLFPELWLRPQIGSSIFNYTEDPKAPAEVDGGF